MVVFNLDGSNAQLRPTVPDQVNIGDVSITILSSNGETKISNANITVCCHPRGKI